MKSKRDEFLSYLILSYRFTKFYTLCKTIFLFSKISNPIIIIKIELYNSILIIIIIIMKIKNKI